MSGNNQYAIETARLRDQSAELRLKSIQAQLVLAFTWCALAEAEIHFKQSAEASKIVRKLHHSADIIRFHLNDAHYVPQSASGLQDKLAQLEIRIKEIEEQLGPIQESPGIAAAA